MSSIGPQSEALAPFFSLLDDGQVLCNPATAIAFDTFGILIFGASGTGKSTLGVNLLAVGAELIADDAVLVRSEGSHAMLERPPNLPALIEVRGIGLLRAVNSGPKPLRLAVDLNRKEPNRLPPHREIDVLGHNVPLILGAGIHSLGHKLRLFALQGRADEPS